MMSCESLKNLTIYGGIIIVLDLCIWMILTQNKMNKLIKLHGIGKEALKNDSASIPKEVTSQIAKLKVAGFARVLVFGCWIALLFLVTGSICRAIK